VRAYPLPGAQASVTASIGISMFPDDAADASALMKHADMAMYRAKQAGKNCVRFYSSGPAANRPGAQPGGVQARVLALHLAVGVLDVAAQLAALFRRHLARFLRLLAVLAGRCR
jgi:hypothetical protein